jgi:hypothetical protein
MSRFSLSFLKKDFKTFWCLVGFAILSAIAFDALIFGHENLKETQEIYESLISLVFGVFFTLSTVIWFGFTIPLMKNGSVTSILCNTSLW